MKVTRSLILILLISNFGIFIYGINAEGANWKSYGKKHSRTTGYLYYYDKDSTVRPTKGIVKVWAKYVITEEGLQKRKKEIERDIEEWEAGREERKAESERVKAKLRKEGNFKMLKLLEAVQKVADKYGGVDEAIEKERTLLFEMNCSERTFRIIETYWYRDDGKYCTGGWIQISPTVSLSSFPTGWYNIHVDTYIEALYETVCRRSIFPW